MDEAHKPALSVDGVCVCVCVCVCERERGSEREREGEQPLDEARKPALAVEQAVLVQEHLIICVYLVCGHTWWRLEHTR